MSSTIKRALSVLMVFAMLMGLCSVDVKETEAASAVTIRIRKSDVSGRSFTKTVQKALDDAGRYATSQRRYIVKVETGGRLTESLHIFSNTTLDLGNNVITNDKKNISKGTVGNMLVCGYTNKKYSAGYDSFNNITIKGGTWDGNASGYKSTAKGSCMMRFAHIRNLNFENVTIKNALEIHHVEFASADGVKFKNCTFEGMKINNYGTGSHVALQLDTNHDDENFPGYLPHDDLSCRNVTITGCKFNNVERGIGSDHVIFGKYYENIKINKCKFTNISGRAITAYSWKNGSVTKCNFKSVAEGIRCSTKLDNITYANEGYYKNNPKYNYNAMMKITDNTFSIRSKNVKGYSQRAAIIAGGSSGDGNKEANGTFCASGFVIKNNTVKRSGAKKGIVAQHMQGSAHSEITNNKIHLTKTATKGILVQNANIDSITGNVIDSNGKYEGSGINVKDSTVGIIGKKGAGNRISGCKNNGINICEVSHVKSIRYNTVSNVNRTGISLKESYVSKVEKNKISRAKRYGIFSEYTDTDRMTGNRVSKSKIMGIYVGEGSKINYTNDNKVTSTKHKGSVYEAKAVLATKPNIIMKKGKKRKCERLVLNDVKGVKFWSSKKKVVTINGDGKIEAHKKGKCKIIASYKGTKTVINVKVVKK